jgi:hypothetical protein
MATIQFRRGTAANIQLVNPTPLSGELVLEYDTKRFKIGDGVTPYNLLPYSGDCNLTFLKGESIGTGKIQTIAHHFNGIPFVSITPLSSGARVDEYYADEHNIYVQVKKDQRYKLLALML